MPASESYSSSAVLPASQEHSTHSFGSARFHFLTDRMLRMEWSENSVFEDRMTLAVSCRDFPPVRVTVTEATDEVFLETATLRVHFRPDGKPFHPGNLRISVSGMNSMVEWVPGIQDPENLKGTVRTLDRVDGCVQTYRAPNENPGSREQNVWLSRHLDLGQGLLSRSGWTLIDDSGTPVLSRTESGEWATARPEAHRIDWYFLAYGKDYTQALRDASGVFGRQPLPPRYTFGYWWSRFWAYTDRELLDLVSRFEEENLPLSVLVVDMDWHLEGWTGYTWDRRFFPDPDGFLRELKRRGLKVTLNIHPHDGVGKHEEQFPRVARSLGMDPDRIDHIPFDPADPDYMDACFRLLHHPEERRGVDFWWLDWQQGERSRIPGLDPLPWLNHLHWKDMEDNPERQGLRPLVFSRYGGVGSGRYPIGFSGDTYQSWESLSFQPYFTATAANVLYGYWSHDIGGHFAEEIDPELYTRWLQWGQYSPVMRTHAVRSPEGERRVWEYPEPYKSIMMRTIRERHRLIPYLYTEAKKTSETGVSLCRPLYYHHQEAEEAYQHGGQYYFGDSMLLAPVCRPVSPHSGMAEVDIWLPPGEWLDAERGKRESGGRVIRRSYLLEEVPLFVRPGTIIPELGSGGDPFTGRFSGRAGLTEDGRSYRSLRIRVYAGASGEYSLYEDDGESTGYQNNQCVRIGMRYEENRNLRKLTIIPGEGGYEGFESRKELEVSLYCAAPPLKVIVDGIILPFDRTQRPGSWSYDGDRAAVMLNIGRKDLNRECSMEIIPAKTFEEGMIDGLSGIMRRVEKAFILNRLIFSLKDCHPKERMIVGMAQTGRRVSLHPETFPDEMRRLRESLAEYPGVLAGLRERFSRDDKKYGYCTEALELLAASKDILPGS